MTKLGFPDFPDPGMCKWSDKVIVFLGEMACGLVVNQRITNTDELLGGASRKKQVG